MTKQAKIVVLGATGQVGREILQCLAGLNVPLDGVVALATAQSAGAVVSYGDEDETTVGDAKQFDFTTATVVLAALPEDAAAQMLPAIAKQARVVDCSATFRMDADVPLVVSGVNEATLGAARRNIVAVPDPITCMLATVVKPLNDAAHIERTIVSTYQAASGMGRAGMDELFSQSRAVFVNDPIVKELFPKQIAFNAIPHIGNFRTDGQTDAEFMLAAEMKKIFNAKLKVTATCVRIPSFIGTGMAVTLECENELDIQAARAALRKQSGIAVVDHRMNEGYATPVETAGEDSIYVSRIREDSTSDNGLSLWVVADTTRAGVALNAVRVALQWAGTQAALPRMSTVH